MTHLYIGVKRRTPRLNDAKAKSADQAFRAVRGRIKESQAHRCHFCGFESKNNEVHHVDDNHHNNADDNLVVICKLCHPYHHVGEAARPSGIQAEKDGHIPPKAAALLRVAKTYSETVTPQDLNHLMRVIGMALSDKEQAPAAKAIYAKLVDSQQLKHFADAVYGKDAQLSRVNPADVAAGMARLTQDEYEQRHQFVKDVRIIYHPAYLAQMGSHLKQEAGALKTPSQWSKLLEKEIARTKSLWIADNQAAQAQKEAQANARSEDEDEEEDDDD